VRRRLHDEVAAVAPDVQPTTQKVASAVAHVLVFWELEEDVAATTPRDRLGCQGEFAVRPFQIGQGLVAAVAGIDIEHEKA
jgi:hypothetical protein